jgi:hypothetical protein
MLIITLVACSENGSPTGARATQPTVKGVEDVDVLNTHGGIEGLERMQEFYEKLQKGIASDLRIVHYTIEGDPMVTDLTFNGDSLEVKHDFTRDAYGSGEIIINNCLKMIEEANSTNLSYIAIDCSGIPEGKDEILQINYNMSEQDLFELELKYGVELENEINTLTKTTKKEITTTETEEMSDFEMPESVKQEVYKKLVFANYLAEKVLGAKCDKKDAMKYQLKVHINGGQREFQWTACDQSVDGVKLTEIAEYMIEQSQIKK